MNDDERAQLRAAIEAHYERWRFAPVREAQWDYVLAWCERLGVSAADFRDSTPPRDRRRPARYVFQTPGERAEAAAAEWAESERRETDAYEAMRRASGVLDALGGEPDA